jgi:N-acylneuraminate cytidylyltransferase
MFCKDYITAVIPARGGSKGVLKKNIRLLNGKPLITYTIEAAKNSKFLDSILVATEDEEIASIAKKSNVDIVMINPEMAQDKSPLDPVYEYTIREVEKRGKKTDVAMLLQPTSPLRDEENIDGAIQTFFRKNADSLVSAKIYQGFLWSEDGNGARPLNYDPKNRPLRQERSPLYREQGAIYMTKKELLFNEHCRLGGKVALYVMSDEKSANIDSIKDFEKVEKLLENQIKV